MHDRRLRAWMQSLERTGWSSLVLDAQDTLVWVSPSFKAFLHENDDQRIGVGKHIIEALGQRVWLEVLTAESAQRLAEELLPRFRSQLGADEARVVAGLDEPFRSALQHQGRASRPEILTGRFDYVAAPGRRPLRVDYLVLHVHDKRGDVAGTIAITHLGIRAPLLALLAQGDERMYERMERLVVPGRHQAAILFADLEHSAELSRRLPTARYFDLISRLTECFDLAVADADGIVGKHAGDGWTAFFLADDAGSTSGAAANALRTARRVQAAVQAETAELTLDRSAVGVNAALHWGGSIYLGQLVPGERLEVSALGDEVNECARMQEAARGGTLLASKTFMELLEREALREAGLNADEVAYELLGSLPGVGEKVIRDAATIAVCRL